MEEVFGMDKQIPPEYGIVRSARNLLVEDYLEWISKYLSIEVFNLLGICWRRIQLNHENRILFGETNRALSSLLKPATYSLHILRNYYLEFWTMAEE